MGAAYGWLREAETLDEQTVEEDGGRRWRK